MTFSDWYLTLFCLGTGATILGFWAVVIGTGRLDSLLGHVPGAAGHVLAELLSGGALVAGGVALLIDPDAAASATLAALGIGTVIYALTGSPGMYTQRMLKMSFIVGWVFAIPALVVLFAR